MVQTAIAVQEQQRNRTSTPGTKTPAQALVEATRKANHLPVAPPIAFQLTALLRSPNYSCEAVVDLVKMDADLTTQILRLCNSVEFHASHGITSLQEAVLRLGNGLIAHKVMSLTVGRLFSVRKTAYCPDPNLLWRHSVQCALAARYLVKHCKGFNAAPDLCFTAGLLHDIGKMVINFADEKLTNAIVERVETGGMEGADAELEVLGADHAEIGAAILEGWGIPSEITTAVCYHHTPDFEDSGLANLLHVANACAKVSAESGSWDDFDHSLHPHTLVKLQLTPSSVQVCWEDVLHDVNAIESFMWG